MTYKKQVSLILTLIINFLQYDKYKFDPAITDAVRIQTILKSEFKI